MIICGRNDPSGSTPVLLAANKLGMMTPEYVYITPYYTIRSLFTWEPWSQTNDTVEKERLYSAFKNAILVSALKSIVEYFLGKGVSTP